MSNRGRAGLPLGGSGAVAVKRSVRREIRRLRADLTEEKKREWDCRILERLLELPEIAQARCVYLYASCGQEVDTWGIADRLWARGVKAAFPRVEGADIVFYLVSGREQLAAGFRDIPEPSHDCVRAEYPDAPVVTPGMAFAETGERIGYGGGFYDRFFEREPEHLRIAVAYPFQIYESLETEECDRPVHRIVSAGQGREIVKQ